MNRALIAWATVALTLLSPLSVAGTEAHPEVDDSRDQTDPTKDLLSAWLTSEPGGLRFTLKIVELTTPTVERFYAVTFFHNGTRYIAGVSFDANGELVGHIAPHLLRLPRGPTATWGNDSLGVREFELGSPARFTALIPWRAIPDFEPGQSVTNIGGSVYSASGSTWVESETQRTTNAFFMKRTLIPSAAQEFAPLALLIVVPLVIGVTGGRILHRRSSRRTTRNLNEGLRAISQAEGLPPTRRFARLTELAAAHAALRAKGHLDARAHHRLVLAVRTAARIPTRSGARFDLGVKSDELAAAPPSRAGPPSRR